MNYYFLIASLIAAGISTYVIYQEWATGGFNLDSPTELDCALIICISCFVSLFWPVLTIIPPMMGVRKFIQWYESKKRK